MARKAVRPTVGVTLIVHGDEGCPLEILITGARMIQQRLYDGQFDLIEAVANAFNGVRKKPMVFICMSYESGEHAWVVLDCINSCLPGVVSFGLSDHNPAHLVPVRVGTTLLESILLSDHLVCRDSARTIIARVAAHVCNDGQPPRRSGWDYSLAADAFAATEESIDTIVDVDEYTMRLDPSEN